MYNGSFFNTLKIFSDVHADFISLKIIFTYIYLPMQYGIRNIVNNHTHYTRMYIQSVFVRCCSEQPLFVPTKIKPALEIIFLCKTDSWKSLNPRVFLVFILNVIYAVRGVYYMTYTRYRYDLHRFYLKRQKKKLNKNHTGNVPMCIHCVKRSYIYKAYSWSGLRRQFTLS